MTLDPTLTQIFSHSQIEIDLTLTVFTPTNTLSKQHLIRSIYWLSKFLLFCMPLSPILNWMDASKLYFFEVCQ